ncbi:MAG: hypothetical protein DMG14_35875 [Acidobacteria bacterium]|nr:MAG: hypothetical protein DMG14_35875 [Acidobacteriota bacterium]
MRPRARQDLGDVWGTDDLPFFSRYDGLMYFRITPLGEYCLGIASSYESAPIEVRPVLRVLPNLEIAAIGPDLERGDRRALDAYATQMGQAARRNRGRKTGGRDPRISGGTEWDRDSGYGGATAR